MKFKWILNVGINSRYKRLCSQYICKIIVTHGIRSSSDSTVSMFPVSFHEKNVLR